MIIEIALGIVLGCFILGAIIYFALRDEIKYE